MASPSTSSVTPLMVQRLVLRASSRAHEEDAGYPAIRNGGTYHILDDGAGLADVLSAQLRRRGFRTEVLRRDEVVDTVTRGPLDALILLAPASGCPDRGVKDAFRLLRAAGPALREAGGSTGALLVTVSRLDGAFGTRNLPADVEPASGGLAGLAKTAGHEWPEVSCRAIDLDPAFPIDRAAEVLAAEILGGGPVEVGLSAQGRSTLELHPVPLPFAGASTTSAHAPLAAGDVVVVTGGARGVTAEVAVALAETFRPRLVLLGRSAAPTEEPGWLAGLLDESEIKRALATRANGHATPRKIGEEFHRIAANREILTTLRRIVSAGGSAEYRQVDVRDADAIHDTLHAIRAAHGPVRGFVHGAGVLADRRIEDKTDAQFDDVYDTKVLGARALLESLGPDELRLLVLFSSSTARFGRTGQVAYAAANEVLNKLAQREAHRRPSCRVVSVNWGPWDGGMVTPSLRSVFEGEGIGLIPLGDGARFLVEEIRSSAERAVEIVVLGGDSIPSALVGRVARASSPAPAEPREDAPVPPPTPSSLTTVFERPLDVDALPVLCDHVIDGRGVLPFALTLEWLSHGALQRNPGLRLAGVDDLRLLKGAVLKDERPLTLAVAVGRARRSGEEYLVPVELRGEREGNRSVLHARGEVVLTSGPLHDVPPTLPIASAAYPRAPRSIYHDILFHGPSLQGIERVDSLGREGLAAWVQTNPAPTDWVDRPLRQGWLTDPLALDCAFQLLSLWCHEQTGAPSLPTCVGRYRQYRHAFPREGIRVVARVERPAEHRAVADIEFVDAEGQIVARLSGYECVIDGSLSQAFRRNRLAHARAVHAPR